MVSVGKIILGGFSFFIGYIVAIVLETLITPLLSAITSIFTSSDLSGISWFITIIMYILLVIIMPLFLIVNGLLTENDNPNKHVNILIAVFIFIFSLLLTMKGWYAITALATFATSGGLVNILYWIGLIGTWVTFVIISPVWIIIDATKQ